MTNEEFDNLVTRIESLNKKSPSSYKLRVFFLALLGYAYIFFVLFSVVGLSFFMVLFFVLSDTDSHIWMLILAKKLLIPFIILAFVILRSFWIKFHAPEGIEIKRKDAPKLFETLDNLREKLRGPRIHRVIIDDDFNAGVSQIPRLGIFGWHKNHLILGLPYMLLQSTEQFTAVLAHEYGHLSGSHGRFSAWIYRIRRTYFRILEALQIQDHWGSFLFKVFFNRYVPYFDAYSFVLARANEFEADKVSVEVTSSSAAAESLLLGTFGSRFLSEKFWKKINNNADTSPTPDVTPYLNMSSAFREHVSKEATDRWLKYARAEETESSDTHPALGQRLKAIGQEIRLVPVSPLSSATALLGDTLLSDLTKKLDLEWQENVRDAWQDRFDYATKSNARIVELEVLATSGSISDDNLFELASLTEEFRDIKTALSIYENVLENEATHAGANFAIGRIFLDKNDKEGLPYIEKAMVENPDNYLRSGAEWLYHFYKDNDNKEKAEKYYDIAIKSAEDEERIEAERNLYEDDELEPHGLSLEESENFLEQLKGFASLRSAFLATKKLELSPETPLYVLAVMRKWSGLRTKKSDSNFRQELIDVLTFPGECIVATLNDESGDLKSALKKAKIKPLYKKSLF